MQAVWDIKWAYEESLDKLKCDSKEVAQKALSIYAKKYEDHKAKLERDLWQKFADSNKFNLS